MDRSSRKRQLGGILVRQGVISEEELAAFLESQKSQPGVRLGSIVAASRKARTLDVLKALSRQQGVPAIDLAQIVLPLGNLELVPEDIATQHQILPIIVEEQRVFLAMSDPWNRRIVDEIEFVTGRKVMPYVALHRSLREVIKEAYRLRARGDQHYIGTQAPPDYLESLGLGSDERPLPASSEGSGVIVDPAVFAEVADYHLIESLTPESGSHPRPRSDRLRILVVDDEEDIRRMLRRNLEGHGYEVVEASHGREALGLVREHVPDLIVLDAMLPGVHGFDLCRRVKGSQRYGNIPIIMISAVYRGWRVAEDLRESYGVSAFLEKPFKLESLIALIEDALAGRVPDEPSHELSAAAREHLHRGLDAYKAGDIDMAIQEMQRGLNIDPLSFQLHYHLGLLYGRKEDTFAAIHELETAVDLQPRSFSALRNLAVLYQSVGFRHKSIEMWERALAAAPDEDIRSGIKSHLVKLF